MKPSKDTYRIVEERDLDKFQRRANALIEQGWEPQGGLVVGTSRYLQAFIQRRQKGHVAGFKFSFGLPTSKPKPHMPVAVTITNEQKVTASLAPVTDTGKAAKLDGAPVWSVVTGTGTVVPAADGLSAELISGDDPGDTQYLVKADADLGQGVVEISDTIDLTVQGALATNLGIAISAPVPKA
jgi:hypothetical protein